MPVGLAGVSFSTLRILSCRTLSRAVCCSPRGTSCRSAGWSFAAE